MGKKGKRFQGKGEELKIDFGSKAPAESFQQPTQTNNNQSKAPAYIEEKKQDKGVNLSQFSALQPEQKSQFEPVDFMAESSQKQSNKPNQSGHGKRGKQFQQREHIPFQFETPQQSQGGRGRGRGKGQQRQEYEAVNFQEESKAQKQSGKQGQGHQNQVNSQQISSQAPKKNRQGDNEYYQHHKFNNEPDLPNMRSDPPKEEKKFKEKQKIELPPLKEEVRAELLQQYQEYDLAGLLKGQDVGQGQDFSMEHSQRQLLALIYQLQKLYNKQGQAPLPQQKHVFGKEAIQPIQPPLNFSLDGERKNFDIGIAPWCTSQDTILSQLLLRHTVEQVNDETLDPLFHFPLDDAKLSAACCEIKHSKVVQNALNEKVHGILDQLHSKLVKSDNIELDQSTMLLNVQRDCGSGQLTGFTFEEPKEQFELEPDFEGNAKEILVSQRLNDQAEIDQILEEAADPFDEVSEDEDSEQANRQISNTFLLELREMKLQSREDQALKERQAAKANWLADEKEKLKAQQEKKLVQDDEENSEEESKEEVKAIPEQEERQPSDSEESQSKTERVEDQIDEIVGSSTAYQSAVDQSRLFPTSSKLQAEPSHFHLATVANERKNPQQPADSSVKAQDQNWVVTDKKNMENFKDLVQNPAIEYPFELDDFQKRAVYRLEQGNCVMVAAHTSAGKTLVAEYAIALSRRHMTKTIYTSPIKSLSNQKYRDFKLKFGDVGVLTGDVQLNKDASCMIMTTEVLQAMLYNSSSYLQDVEWVIFDEVHYITDEERGSVWEEVIIKLPDTVSIVMLSATVPNYLEFATWVGRVKQKKIYVQYTQQRPVPLSHNAIIDGKILTVKQQDKNTDMNTLKKCFQQRGIIRNKQQMQQPSKQEEKAEEQKLAKEKQERAKKIDFKAKAIKAKENSVKKVVSKAMKGGGGGQGGNQTGQKKRASTFQKSLEAVQREGLLPCIVFAFSRAGTVKYAEELDPSTDFTDGYTKGLIKKFIKQKLQRLDEVDRDLPQIQTVTRLLVRGIGVHHAGLIQLLKELVEILFSDGYLKLVFATSTFAIGLNLPARSVVFTELQKFDGTDRSTITTSEYLQMAGRAGRRGKDDVGYSLLCMDPGMGKMPRSEELTELLDSKGIALESKLKVDYSTCLNSLKQDQEGFGAMLENSFFANENASIKINAQKKKRRIEPILERASQIDCIHGVSEQAFQFFQLIDELWNINDDLSFQKPSPLSIVEVVSGKHIFKQMIVLKHVGERSSLALYVTKDGESVPLKYEENKAESFESAKRTTRVSSVTVQGEKGKHQVVSYEIVQIQNFMITQGYSGRITCFRDKELRFVDKAQLVDKQAKMIVKEFCQIRKNLQLESLKVSTKRKKFNELIAKREQVIDQLKSKKCYQCEQVSFHMTQVEVLENYQAQMKELEQILEGNMGEKEQDFENRNKVLQHYKIIDGDYNLLFKGKVATQVTAVDKILLTEFFFSGFMNELTDQELLALLSVFVTRERAPGSVPDCGKQYSDKFSDALSYITTTAEKLIDLEQTHQVVEETITFKRINLKFYELVYDWADGKTFADCVIDSGIDEGAVVKMILAVNRVRVCVEQMATVVGDNALASRLKEMDPLTNRGLVKMQSLYLEVEQEPPRLREAEEVLVRLPSSSQDEEAKVGGHTD